ncbi:MAG: hypothetical protein A2931_03780 [Candidatus Niyogibacteria bacterium RIFCSPLOWO2_01_FULL_45_48]|uniref:M23ase beta-sheet core domain-containing protein n=2 Tax=Candidatus Niyogiibacteriota TaxID=1817912 RepID=A0A1G2EXY9_9BACT|nr:MAG: hypothetical protein A2835_00510 [Candidatus Niyogibacteria bacterium RIFCSPHIGHO2_01_FULL_45_28]OGZ30633.1 MAG: hypothetical protein A3J00_00475 [Candidatus Niyogibacteria bacterium RIFCSPLOWO2_02_FULL_45_13]OGZ31494.1 MAG: hypothetical protein A2931_03780 [Candidatus Niyogibacteria bacterium RIFCSPLOWO2_01_FULL_45_48]
MRSKFLTIAFIFIFVAPVFADAESVDELRSEIEEKNAQIKELEEEIAEFQTEIDKTSKETGTLKNQVGVLTKTINKLLTDIKVTQKKVEAAELTLEELQIGIAEKGSETEKFKNALAEIVRNMNEIESQSLIEIMLARPDLSGFFSDIDYIESLSSDLGLKLNELKEAKIVLEAEKSKQEKTKLSLQSLRLELDSRKSIEEDARIQKNNLLKITQNKEAEYKELLDDRLSKKEALEAEIRSIEEELRITIDPSSLPSPGSGVLKWPLNSVFITQYFGNTPFATQNPQVYGGKGHNGIDLRASIGTPVKSSADGVVIATGNTDLQRGCYSYGKWALVKHPNNLSTLYAHLSLISVSPGQNISGGQLVGYSGNTGYSTGPHLHFTVFASEGVRVVRLGDVKKVTNCANMEIPIAPFNVYLNPLTYL